MKLLIRIAGLLVVALVVVHGYFYLATGYIDPCRAAVTRMIQTQRAQGRELVAGFGVLFSEPLENVIRSEGVAACYRVAITGQPPEEVLKLKIDKDGIHPD
jgi:hypothetical protein